MNYEIIMRDKTQIEITEKDFNNISEFLGKLKLFKLENGQIVNAVDISRINPVVKQQVIPKDFRLNEPNYKEEKRKMEKINISKGFENLFNLLKSKGLFKDFKNYTQYADRDI